MNDADRRSGELMTRLNGGDDDALASLIALWQQPVLRFVFRYVQSEAEARDVVQETFVRVHANRGAFRSGATFSSWVFTIAANLCRNHLRWRTRHPSESLDADPAEIGSGAERQPCPRAAPDRAAVESERVRAVREAIAALPHDLKVTLLLHEYEELSCAEIAPVVGCSVKGVEARLARARQRLRAMLAGYLGDGASGAAGAVAAFPRTSVAGEVR